MTAEECITIKALLEQYKTLTAKLIEILENEDYASLENVFKLRENIIKEIDVINLTSFDFNAICEEISLLPLQKKLTLLMNEKKAMLKNEISNLKNSKVANNNYNKGYSIDSLYFNKKI